MRFVLALLLLCFTASAQTVSYFNQGFLRQPSALADRNYLGIYGSNIFYWGTNAPWGTNVVCTNYVLKAGDTMTGKLTVNAPLVVGQTQTNFNSLFVYTYSTNLFAGFTASNDWGTVTMSDGVTPMAMAVYDPGNVWKVLIGYDGSIHADNFTGNGAGLTNVPTVGLTTNFTVILSNGDTNQLFFTNGLLVAMNSGTPIFVGFYLLNDVGDYILTDTGQRIIVNP